MTRGEKEGMYQCTAVNPWVSPVTTGFYYDLDFEKVVDLYPDVAVSRRVRSARTQLRPHSFGRPDDPHTFRSCINVVHYELPPLFVATMTKYTSDMINSNKI